MLIYFGITITMISLSAILIIWGVRGDTYTHEMITRCGLATTFAAVILLLACPIIIFSWISAGGRHEAHFGTAREAQACAIGA